MRWGRDYYTRGAVPGGDYRNGYRMARVKSAEGTIECSAPRIAEWDEPFRSCLRAIIGGRTETLQTLVNAANPGGGDVRPPAVDPRHLGQPREAVRRPHEDTRRGRFRSEETA